MILHTFTPPNCSQLCPEWTGVRFLCALCCVPNQPTRPPCPWFEFGLVLESFLVFVFSLPPPFFYVCHCFDFVGMFCLCVCLCLLQFLFVLDIKIFKLMMIHIPMLDLKTTKTAEHKTQSVTRTRAHKMDSSYKVTTIFICTIIRIIRIIISIISITIFSS